MLAQSPIRVIIDTNVVFEGLTKQGGASGLIGDFKMAEQALGLRAITPVQFVVQLVNS